jgi:hypothetical protein
LCLAAGVSVPRSTFVHTPEGGDLHPPHEVEGVLRLVASGRNDCQISRATGISRSTIRERYAYVRYFFTNTSTDILQIFRDACDLAGIPHRDSKPNTISIAQRAGVETLDSFIGPKA